MRDANNRYRRRLIQYTDKIPMLFPTLFDRNRNYDGYVIKDTICRTITFQVTDACNLACTYCYQINKSTRRMSFETAKKFVDMLITGEKGMDKYIDATISPYIILDFIGGEPFLEIELIDQILDYFMDRCIELNHPWATKFIASFSSNGTLYRDPKVQKFLNKHRKHISLSVTLDGNKELHDKCRLFPDGRGSYDIALDACTDWMSRGYPMGSKITIAPENVGSLYSALKHMIDLDYNDIMANCVYEEGWEPSHALIMYEQMKKISDFMIEKDIVDDIFVSLFDEENFRPMPDIDDRNWCGGTGLMMAVDPDGYIYPCIRYMESSLGKDIEPYRIGDVDAGMNGCKEYCNRIDCLNCITRSSQSTVECFRCPIAQGCGWCSGYNYQIYGTPNKRAIFICIMHKARALGTAYLFSRWYEKHYPTEKYKFYVPKSMALEVISEEEYEFLISSPNIKVMEKEVSGNEVDN